MVLVCEKDEIAINGKCLKKPTEPERDVILNGFGRNEYSDGNGEAVWSFSIGPNCRIAKPKQVSGVMASLVKKKLAWTQYGGSGKGSEDDSAGLTDDGKAMLVALRKGID